SDLDHFLRRAEGEGPQKPVGIEGPDVLLGDAERVPGLDPRGVARRFGDRTGLVDVGPLAERADVEPDHVRAPAAQELAYRPGIKPVEGAKRLEQQEERRRTEAGPAQEVKAGDLEPLHQATRAPFSREHATFSN